MEDLEQRGVAVGEGVEPKSGQATGGHYFRGEDPDRGRAVPEEEEGEDVAVGGGKVVRKVGFFFGGEGEGPGKMRVGREVWRRRMSQWRGREKDIRLDQLSFHKSARSKAPPFRLISWYRMPGIFRGSAVSSLVCGAAAELGILAACFWAWEMCSVLRSSGGFSSEV